MKEIAVVTVMTGATALVPMLPQLKDVEEWKRIGLGVVAGAVLGIIVSKVL